MTSLRLLLVLWAVVSGPVLAQEPPPPVPAPEEEGLLEATRASVRASALWLARSVDSWFGDKPFSDGGRLTDGQLSLGVLRRPPNGNSVSLRFNARFRLPNLEDRAYLFLGRDDRREVVKDQPAALTRQQRLQSVNPEDSRFFAGFGLDLRESTDLRVGFRGGLKPFVQLRYRHPFELRTGSLAEFRETIFLTVDDGLGSTTALSVDHALTRQLSVRWLSAATVTQKSRRWDGSSILGAYRVFGPQRLLSLELVATAVQNSGVGLTDYGVQARWQQPVHEDWLIGEVVVGHFWPRADSTVLRAPGWALGGTMRLRF